MTPEMAVALNAPLATERLALEPRVAAHADAMFAPLQEEAIYAWISTPRPVSVELLRERWGRVESRMSPGGDAAWLNWVVRRVSDGACVGNVDAEVDGAGVAINVGYIFFPAFWGNGYATEAVRAVVDQLVRHGVTELRATVTLGNAASARVLEKAGFTMTRVIPENDTIRGVKYDDVEYVLHAG